MSEIKHDPLVRFGTRVREMRHERRITQAELARLSGLQESWISHFEVGRRKPSVQNLLRLADALDCSADWLLGRKLNRNILRES